MQNKKQLVSFIVSTLLSSNIYASFIEATMGTAVVNDATASYYNPAALTLLKNSQIITLGSVGSANDTFTGQATQSISGFTQSGRSNSHSNYFLPSIYLATHESSKLYVGIAIVSNLFNKEPDENSILRYSQSSNSIKNIDFVPAAAIQLNKIVSIGAAINLSYADFLLRPITGFPTLDIPDNQSNNDSNGTGIGGDIGILLKPKLGTTIGLNYRSAISYKLHGTSKVLSHPEFISNNYHFTFWTPARTVLSINQFFTQKLALITTVQYVQWNIFDEVNIHGIATEIGNKTAIVDADVPYHFKNSWMLTVGGQYQIMPPCVLRFATTYNQSPGNNHYQITNGDSVIVGASFGYDLSKHITLDGSYAYGFIQNENIDITGGRNIFTGINRGNRQSASLKLTINI